MSRSILYAPYARQMVPGRIRWWVGAWISREVRPFKRYEVFIGGCERCLQSRIRRQPADGHAQSYFLKYLLPENLTDYPSMEFDYGRDKIVDMVLRLLPPEDLAIVTAFRITGDVPEVENITY